MRCIYEGSYLILLVIARQLTKHGDKSRIISSGANQAKREDGIASGVLVGIVAVLAECLENVQLRVRHTDQRQSERHRAANDRLAIAHEMAEHAQAHLAANLLTHGDESEAKNGHRLLGREIRLAVLLLLLFIGLVVLLLVIL